MDTLYFPRFRIATIKRLLLLLLFCIVYALLNISMKFQANYRTVVYNQNILTFNRTFYRNKKTIKFLFWTDFFGDKRIVDNIQKSFEQSNGACRITADTNEIESADVVVFHLLDLWLWKSLPMYRKEHQIWVLFVLEPPPHIFSLGLSVPNMVFNWTMSYRLDSSVPSPYGQFIELTSTEIEQNKKRNFSISKQKTKMAFSIIGNCVDDARRYRNIAELKKYIDVDEFGQCGRYNCTQGTIECERLPQQYRFKIVFENSNCRDYVSEKFWSALESNVIPIVNWKANQIFEAPKNSYINIYDFKSTKELAEYLVKLSKNDDLYDSYFEWKRRFKIANKFLPVCEKIARTNSYQSQVLINPWAWIDDDTCQRWSIWNMIKRRWDRFYHDLTTAI